MPSTSSTTPPAGANPFLLAADGSAALIPLLREHPELASRQDATGYSLLHALASYNYVDLLRQLVTEFHPPLDLRDEDGETALFVVETVEAAQLLVEELHLDPFLENHEGQTAEQKIREEGDYVVVADYLAEVRKQRAGSGDEDPDQDQEHDSQKTVTAKDSSAENAEEASSAHPPPLPKGMTLNFGTMSEEQAQEVPDEAFRQRIEELALREDFGGPAGQAELRALVKDAVRELGVEEGKEARPRTE